MSVELPYEVFKRVLEDRGGCRCCDPGAFPPCGNCTAEVTIQEAVDGLEMIAGLPECNNSIVSDTLACLVDWGMNRTDFLKLQTWLIDAFDYEGTISRG